MLKDYRKRFILYNMVLSGSVLLVAFVILGTFLYRSEYRTLEGTMSTILKPWNSHSGAVLDPKEKEPEKRTESRDEPDQSKAPRDKPKQENKQDRRTEARKEDDDVDNATAGLFTTAILNRNDDTISVISNDYVYDTELIGLAVREAASSSDSFGKLGKYGMIYYCERTAEDVKVAFITSSYISFKILRTELFLALVFVILITFIFLISLKLSKTAVRPLEQAIEMERNFVADISHDLKTPITIVLTNNSILRSNPTMEFEERKQWTDSTEAAAKNMMKLVNEMLTLSMLESVDKAVNKERVSLSMTAEKCVLQLESVAYEQDITVNTEIDDDVSIFSTAEYTERICTGLIDNALKYEPSGGMIDVKVSSGKKSAVLTVHNHGSFISENDLPHIFERFYRSDKARSTKQGYGLGLPIIKQITELIGARIEAESDTYGTSFTVFFEPCE